MTNKIAKSVVKRKNKKGRRHSNNSRHGKGDTV